MNSIKTLHLGLLIGGLLLVAWAGRALARRPQAPAPPVVAAVRIEPLFDGLQQRAEAKAEVDRIQAQLEAERESREASITKMRDELRDLVAEDKRHELTDQIALEEIRLRFWYQEAAGELEVERALRLQDLYRSIKQAVQEVAQAEGYDMVILDDSIDEPPFDREARIPAQVQVLQQITSRSILYLSPTIDITEDLITRMNNAFRARGPRAAAPGAGVLPGDQRP